jgi:hypothetical protein
MMKDRAGIAFGFSAYENKKIYGSNTPLTIHPRKPRIMLTKRDRLLALQEMR